MREAREAREAREVREVRALMEVRDVRAEVWEESNQLTGAADRPETGSGLSIFLLSAGGDQSEC